MKKRISTLLLCAALLLSLFGCAVASASSVDLMENIKALPIEPSVGLTEERASAVTQFGLDLFRAVPEEKNPLVSPLSVILTLGMTANGAKGETLAQMEAAFGLDLYSLNDGLGSWLTSLPKSKTDKLHIANAIWFKDTPSFTVERNFLQTNANYYGAALYKAPFDGSTCNDINRWVEQHTDGMIRGILDGISEDAVMYLVNALSFDGEWQSIYNESQVREGIFTTADGEERSVTVMHSKEHRWLETPTATGFVKPYKDGRFAFAALLPNEGSSLADCAASLTGEELANLLKNPVSHPVRVTMPKFEAEYAADLSGALRAMGIELAFSGDGDFSGIGTSAEGPLYVSRVIHKTFIAVDEKGTKAGAATAVEMAPTSAPMEDPKTVILDRPFLYFIFDTQTGLPLFMGAVTDPA